MQITGTLLHTVHDRATVRTWIPLFYIQYLLSMDVYLDKK